MPYEIGLGEAIAQGLAQGVTNYTGLQQQGFQNQMQLQQQNIQNLQQQQAREAQQRQQELQNAQQEQARLDQQKQRGEDVTYRNDEASKARDKTLYDHLKGSEDKILAALPTLDKQSLEYGKANSALSLARKLMGKIITPGRTQFTPEELASFDQLNEDLAPVLGRAAEVTGGLILKGQQNTIKSQDQQLEKGAIDLQYLEPTYRADLESKGITNATGQFNLQNIQALAPEQLENLRLENAGKIQALETAKNLSPLQIEGARKNLNLINQQIREATRLNDVADDLQVYDTAGKRSDYLSRMAKSGDKEGLQRLADKGLLSAPELEQFGVQAKQAQRQGEATTVIQEGTATGVGLDNTLKDGRIKLEGATYNYTVRTAAAGADSAETAASQAVASLDLFKAKASSEVEIVKAQAKLIEETLAQTGKVNPLELKALRERVYEAARKNKIGDAFDEKQAQAAYDAVLAGIGLTKVQTTGVEVNTAANQVSLKWLDKELEQKYNINAAQLNRIELMTPLEVAGEKAKIDRAIFELEQDKSPDTGTRATRLAGLKLSQAQLEATSFNTDRAKQLLPNELKEQGIRLDTFQQALDDARAGSADKLGILRTERATLEQTYEQNKIKFPVQMESLRKELKKADLEIEYLEKTQDTRIQVTVDQGKITAAQATEAQDTLVARVDLYNSNASLQMKVNAAHDDLLELDNAGKVGAYLKGLADLGAPGQTILSGLVTRGVITPQQGGAFKAKAGQVETAAQAATDISVAQANIVKLQGEILDKTWTAQVDKIIADKDTALVNLQQARQDLKQDDKEFPKKQEFLDAQIASVKAGTANTKQNTTESKALMPYRVESARLEVLYGNKTLSSRIKAVSLNNVVTLENLKTVRQNLMQDAKKFPVELELLNAQIDSIEAGTKNTAANTDRTTRLTPLEVTGQKLDNSVKSDVAFISAATKGDKITLAKYDAKDAETRFNTNLINLKFIDATFADKVKDVALGTAASTVKLNQIKREYLRDPKKFALELKEIEGRVRYNDAQTDALIAREAPVTGEGGTAKQRATALEGARKATAAELTNARINYKTVADIYFANAKTSIDKYDPKNYATLISNAALTPEQTAQIALAKNSLQEATDRNLAIIRISAARGAGKEGNAKDWAAFGVDITPPKPIRADVPYFAGSGKSPASGLPTTEIEKQIAMSAKLMAEKVGIASRNFKVKGSDTFNDKGWVRAYNGYGRNADGSWMNPNYVGGVQATAQEKPWVSALSSATGARKTELETINSLSETYAKKYKIDPDTVKAIFWNESYGWQPGVNSSDGKGGGLGQFTGYFVKGPGAITWQEAQRRAGGNPSSAAPAAAPKNSAAPATPATPNAPAAPPSSGVKGVAQIGTNRIGSSYLDDTGIQKAFDFVRKSGGPMKKTGNLGSIRSTMAYAPISQGNGTGQPSSDKGFDLYRRAALAGGVKPADADRAAEELLKGVGYTVYKVGDYRLKQADKVTLQGFYGKAGSTKPPSNLSPDKQKEYLRQEGVKALNALTKTFRAKGYTGEITALLDAGKAPEFKGFFQ